MLEFVKDYIEQGAGNAHEDYDSYRFSYTINTASCSFCNYTCCPQLCQQVCVMLRYGTKGDDGFAEMLQFPAESIHLLPTNYKKWATLEMTYLSSLDRVKFIPHTGHISGLG